MTLPPLLNEPWRVWSQVAKSFELDIPDSRIQHVNEEADRRFEGQIYAYHGRTVEFWRLRDTWVIDRLGIETRKEDFFDTVQTIFGDPSLVELYPETMEVLEKLRSLGFPMGIVSNFTDALRDVLEYHGLSGFFDTVHTPKKSGPRSPTSECFHWPYAELAEALRRRFTLATHGNPITRVHGPRVCERFGSIVKV